MGGDGLSATGYYGGEWGALCDKVTQQGWQMIFSEVLSQCVMSNMISGDIFKARLINESYNLFSAFTLLIKYFSYSTSFQIH